jgi:ABC-2 type transport system ATP-binding protein
MDNGNTIAVHNISKRYGNFLAVNDLSFEVNRGELFCMLGHNGAGKTTTIRMILDILKADSGTITVFGAPITAKAKERIGYLPEERGLYRNVKVMDMLIYLGQLKGMTGKDARARAIALLQRMELADHADSKVSALSKGMQQKVQIISTIIHRPDLIIVDELFSGLDPVNTLITQELLYEMKRDGTTIVMSTHQLYQVEEMGDRLLMLSKGACVLYGEVNSVRQQFAKNAVLVEGTGDWQTLNGVKSIETKENGRDVLLYLHDGVNPDSILQAIAASPDHHIRRFERALPSLNEIFIEVSGGISANETIANPAVEKAKPKKRRSRLGKSRE